MEGQGLSIWRGSAWPAVALWASISGAACVYPLLALAIDATRSSSPVPWADLAPRWKLLGETVGWGVLIGVVSAIIAWPGAWLSRGWRAWWSPLLVAPALMPGWLAYSGLGLLRAPGTVLGDWLAMGPSWRAVLAGRVLAVLGLALWASPLAQMVIASRVREVDSASLEAARLIGRGPVLWVRLRLGMSLRRTLIAAGLVAVVMLGSAVPLHLAQMNTYATRLWLELDATGAGERWRVVLGAWPVLAIVFVAAGGVCAGVWRCGRSMRGEGGEHRRAGALGAAVALAVPITAMLVPAALFALDLESTQTITTVWRTESSAIASAWTTALLVALMGVLIACCVWIGLGAGRWARRVTMLGVGASLVMALLPGVVTGVLVASSWNSLSEGTGIVIMAHLARFSALPAVIGVLLALGEPSEDRDLRLLVGATGPIAWARTSGARGWPALAASGVAIAGLSLHEIESAVVVAPPGAPSLARSMLGLLHFQRYEHLAGLALVVIGFGTLIVLFASGLWWSTIRTGSESNPNQGESKPSRKESGPR